jgi:DNA invertase Pin-like site-specific DNA recombinase
MNSCYLYLRTSGDDGSDKCGIDVQQQACNALAAAKGFAVVETFPDDGWSGKKFHLHARPAGKRLIAALLADGVKTVIVYNASRIGRSQPVYWRAIELFRDNDITVYDAAGTNLCESVMGGVNGMLAEMDHTAIVSRLRAGKNAHRAKDATARVDGRWPYGQHPNHKYDAEREVLARMKAWDADGICRYQITKKLNEEGILTRYKKPFCQSSVKIILDGRKGGTSNEPTKACDKRN